MDVAETDTKDMQVVATNGQRVVEEVKAGQFWPRCIYQHKNYFNKKIPRRKSGTGRQVFGRNHQKTHKCKLWVTKHVSGTSQLLLMMKMMEWGSVGKHVSECEHISLASDIKREEGMNVTS